MQATEKSRLVEFEKLKINMRTKRKIVKLLIEK